MDILKLDHVAKSFGTLEVIKNLSFTVGEHSVFGLIGKNGAGKTTTMKMVLGLLKQSGGEIFVCGEKVSYGNTKTNRFIGYLPDVPEFYGFMRPKEYLKLCGEISGLKPSQIIIRSEELLALVGLDNVNRRIGGFSRGMKQRLGIAQALLGQPKLLICDEPTSALDPVGRKEILDILSVASKQTSIIFSTHILSDVERICEEIGILDGGRLALSGKLADVKNTYRSDTVLIEPAKQSDQAALAEKLKALPAVKDAAVKDHSIIVRLGGTGTRTDAKTSADGGTQSILEFLAHAKTPVVKFEVLEPSLEDVFLEVIK
jgi:ABC-2 type transport system ATP-binding protein